MLDLTFTSNVDDVIGLLDDIEVRHVPFALSVALNETAREAQAEVKRQLSDRFIIRRDWVARGIRTRFSTKTNLEALVFTADWFMETQEEGGIRRPQTAPSIFVPTLASREGGSLRGRVAGKRPKTLLRDAARAKGRKRRRRRKDGSLAGRARRPLAFIAPVRGGGQGLFIRRDHRRLPIVLLYKLEDAIRIEPRWGFEPTVERVSDKHLRLQFAKAMQHSLATDRRGARRSSVIEHLIDYDGRAGLFDGGGVLSGLAR